MDRAATDPKQARIGVGLPQLIDEDAPRGPGPALAAYARRAEALGFAGLWTLDSVPGGPTAHMPLLDALHTLAFAAAVTTTIRLGVAVIVLPRRNPALLAKELASLDRLADGRLTVGVGLGGRDDERAAALGFPTGRRVRRLVEGIAAMRALWAQDGPPFAGETIRFADMPLEPKPAQRPAPPIWLGGGSEPALRRAARIGDGWIGSGSATSEDFLAQARRLVAALAAENRDPRDFPVAKRVYIAVDGDERRGRRRLAGVLDRMYGRPGLGERCGLAGPPARCAQELTRLLAGGADELVLAPMYDASAQLEALAEVAALVRAG